MQVYLLNFDSMDAPATNKNLNGIGIIKMKYKYPRTPHLPWSPGATNDDVCHDDIEIFSDKSIVITEKMDGENTSIYCDSIHARSIDSRFHPSRTWVKSLQAKIGYRIPKGWRICGENLYARHSIAYENLPSYFMGFSVWNSENHCLSWRETKKWLRQFDIPTPREIYRGPWDESIVKSITIDTSEVEGFVVRLEDGFSYKEFKNSVAKWVRKNHVSTDKHWMHQAVITNGLGESGDE